MIPATQQHDFHTGAMVRSADAYDSLIRLNDKHSTNPLNSLRPNVWLHDACLSGGLWGPQTEFTEAACAIRDSYRFQSRYRWIRYPAIGPKNQDGDEVFAGVFCCETKCLVFGSGQTACEQSCPYSAEALAKHSNDDSGSSESMESLASSEDQTAYRYGLVSDREIDSAYDAFLTGEQSAEQVSELIVDSVQRKLALGTNEFGLRERGAADDLLSQFWQKIYRAILERRFRGDAGSQFSHFVNAIWATLRADSYRKLEREDKRFQSSTEDQLDSDDDDYATTGPEDDYAVSLHELALSDTRREDGIRVHELMKTLTGTDLAIAESLMEGFSTSQTAERVCLSRHSVRRVQKRLMQSMQTAASETIGGVN